MGRHKKKESDKDDKKVAVEEKKVDAKAKAKESKEEKGKKKGIFDDDEDDAVPDAKLTVNKKFAKEFEERMKIQEMKKRALSSLPWVDDEFECVEISPRAFCPPCPRPLLRAHHRRLSTIIQFPLIFSSVFYMLCSLFGVGSEFGGFWWLEVIFACSPFSSIVGDFFSRSMILEVCLLEYYSDVLWV